MPACVEFLDDLIPLFRQFAGEEYAKAIVTVHTVDLPRVRMQNIVKRHEQGLQREKIGATLRQHVLHAPQLAATQRGL